MTKTATPAPPKEFAEDFQAEVPLKAIQISNTNDMFRDPADLTEESLKELMQSIREMGLLQPLLLRPHGNGSFILVAGERRFRACKALGLETVPALVKHISEEVAFELQLTENLQRQDVHPMKEARAYQALIQKHSWKTDELALRFGKSETYVLQRLKLTTLLPEIAKDFAAGDLNLAQALVIARLEKADQEQLLEDCKNYNGKLNNKHSYYESTQVLENYILENITRELAKAPWDLTDAQLVPKAGACSACQKRSGAQGQLFADIKEKDRCFDSECFKSKLAVGLLKLVKKLVEEKPDTIFLVYEGWGEDKPAAQIGSYLASQKIKPLGRGAYSTSNYGSYKKQISGVYINGPQAGKTIKVYVAGPETKAVKAGSASGETKVTAEDIKESIERIKGRTKRAAELDEEKIYEAVIAKASKCEDLKIGYSPPKKADWALVAGLLYEFMGYNQDQIKGLKIPKTMWGSSPDAEQKQADALAAIPQEVIPQLARQVAMKCREAFHLPQKANTSMARLITAAAESWGVDVQAIRKAQAEERTKREARAQERIKELQAQLKPKKAEKGGKKK